MTTVAMVIAQQQWEELCNLESTELDEDRRNFLVRIQDAYKIKKSFDPKRIFNPGKMYSGI